MASESSLNLEIMRDLMAKIYLDVYKLENLLQIVLSSKLTFNAFRNLALKDGLHLYLKSRKIKFKLNGKVLRRNYGVVLCGRWNFYPALSLIGRFVTEMTFSECKIPWNKSKVNQFLELCKNCKTLNLDVVPIRKLPIPHEFSGFHYIMDAMAQRVSCLKTTDTYLNRRYRQHITFLNLNELTIDFGSRVHVYMSRKADAEFIPNVEKLTLTGLPDALHLANIKPFNVFSRIKDLHIYLLNDVFDLLNLSYVSSMVTTFPSLQEVTINWFTPTNENCDFNKTVQEFKEGNFGVSVTVHLTHRFKKSKDIVSHGFTDVSDSNDSKKRWIRQVSIPGKTLVQTVFIHDN